MPRTLTISLQDTAPRETGRLQELPSLSSKPLSHLGPWQPTGSLAHVVQRRELGGLLLSQYQILNQRCSEVAVKISRGGLTTTRKKDYGKFRHASLKQPTSLECVRLLSPMYKLWPFRRRPSHPKTWPPCAWVLVRCSLRPPRRRSSTLEPVGASSESAELHHGYPQLGEGRCSTAPPAS